MRSPWESGVQTDGGSLSKNLFMVGNLWKLTRSQNRPERTPVRGGPNLRLDQLRNWDEDEVMRDKERDITYFAETDWRETRQKFGIRRSDRRFHMYAIGQTGTGKSTLLETLCVADIRNGEGVALIDPHGDLVKKVLEAIPEERKKDVIYFNVSDADHPIAFNPLEPVPPEKRSLAAAELLEVFQRIFSKYWGPRLSHLLRNAFLALLEQPSATLADVLRLFNDESFRRHVAANVSNERVREFWLREYENYSRSLRSESASPVQNKIGAFLTDPILNAILTQPKSAFDVRRVIDEGKILLVNLSKGEIGEDAAILMGSLIISKLGLAAISRANVPEDQRRDFYVYLDEFHNFTTSSIASMLSELRKYRLNMILAHQYIGQLEPEIRDAVFGNVGTIISFRVGADDVVFLARQFQPEFELTDLTRLPNHLIYLKLMIDGIVSKPFSAETLQAI